MTCMWSFMLSIWMRYKERRTYTASVVWYIIEARSSDSGTWLSTFRRVCQFRWTSLAPSAAVSAAVALVVRVHPRQEQSGRPFSQVQATEPLQGDRWRLWGTGPARPIVTSNSEDGHASGRQTARIKQTEIHIVLNYSIYILSNKITIYIHTYGIYFSCVHSININTSNIVYIKYVYYWYINETCHMLDTSSQKRSNWICANSPCQFASNKAVVTRTPLCCPRHSTTVHDH